MGSPGGSRGPGWDGPDKPSLPSHRGSPEGQAAWLQRHRQAFQTLHSIFGGTAGGSGAPGEWGAAVCKPGPGWCRDAAGFRFRRPTLDQPVSHCIATDLLCSSQEHKINKSCSMTHSRQVPCHTSVGGFQKTGASRLTTSLITFCHAKLGMLTATQKHINAKARKTLKQFCAHQAG